MMEIKDYIFFAIISSSIGLNIWQYAFRKNLLNNKLSYYLKRLLKVILLIVIGLVAIGSVWMFILQFSGFSFSKDLILWNFFITGLVFFVIKCKWNKFYGGLEILFALWYVYYAYISTDSNAEDAVKYLGKITMLYVIIRGFESINKNKDNTTVYKKVKDSVLKFFAGII